MKLGITGGIGAGKSYVARLMTEQFGIPVYDCDREAKRLNEASPEIRRQLISLVGENVYTKDGHLDKPTLAKFLFGSDENAKNVNAIIHPIVAKDFEQWASIKEEEPLNEKRKKNIVAMESAILFESGFDKLVSKTICVTAPLELRIQRATERDHASEAAIRQRIEQQMNDEQRQQRADFIIINDGRDIKEQVETILKKI